MENSWTRTRKRRSSIFRYGAKETIIAEDSSVMMEDIFDDLNLDGHQTSTTYPKSVEGEREELEVAATKEVIVDIPQRRHTS